LESILNEQYFLARGANISIQDSNKMPDFERKMFVGMLSKDIKEEQAAYNN
jgi:hypothetical protein